MGWRSRIRDLEKTYPGSGSRGKKTLDAGSGAVKLLQTLIFLTFFLFFLYRVNFDLSESISHPDPGPKHCCEIRPEIIKFSYI
jgi:hypothetical protein